MSNLISLLVENTLLYRGGRHGEKALAFLFWFSSYCSAAHTPYS
jgi:hypothetical protein